MLPDLIPIPRTTAAAFAVTGVATGRDISWALALVLQAAARGESGEVLIDDNRTRELLSLNRRDRIEVEEARWRRLRDLQINGMQAPTVQFSSMGGGEEWPVRHKTAAGELTVTVDDDLMTAFQDTGDDVFLPLRLLQGVDGRYTIPIGIRMLAWCSGAYPRAWRMSETRTRLRLRIPLSDLAGMLDVPSSIRPSMIVSRILRPASEEITSLTDYAIEMTPRIAATTGRIRDIEVDIAVPDIDALLENIPAAEVREGSWRRKDRPTRRQEVVQPASPVVVSLAALDAIAPLSVRRDTQAFDVNSQTDPEEILDPVSYTRDIDIEF